MKDDKFVGTSDGKMRRFAKKAWDVSGDPALGMKIAKKIVSPVTKVIKKIKESDEAYEKEMTAKDNKEFNARLDQSHENIRKGMGSRSDIENAKSKYR